MHIQPTYNVEALCGYMLSMGKFLLYPQKWM